MGGCKGCRTSPVSEDEVVKKVVAEGCRADDSGELGCNAKQRPVSVESSKAVEERAKAKADKTPEPKKVRWTKEEDDTPKSVEDVVNFIDQNLTEIKTPVLSDYLQRCGLPYVEATSQLKGRGWKLDLATRTMRKEVTA